MSTTSPEPGWYLREDDTEHEAYWDGSAWTGHLRAVTTTTPGPTSPEGLSDADLGPERVDFLTDARRADLSRSASSPSAAGWYRDPGSPLARARYWDERWTGRTRPIAGAVAIPASIDTAPTPAAPRARVRIADMDRTQLAAAVRRVRRRTVITALWLVVLIVISVVMPPNDGSWLGNVSTFSVYLALILCLWILAILISVLWKVRKLARQRGFVL